MEWSKAKSLLILLMVAVNLYLGINIYTQLQAQSSQERQMVEDACAILEQRGFIFEREAFLELPAELESWTWARDLSAEREAAQRLLGRCSEECPGGGIYTYSGGGGKVTFRSGGYAEVQPAGKENLDLSVLLKPQGEENRLTMAENDGQYALHLDGYAVEGAVMSRGEGETWSGSWIFAVQPQSGGKSLSRAQLILTAANLLESRGVYTLEQMSCVYTLTALQNGDVHLIPVLVLEADGEMLCISMITGAELTV